jgi:hypothetical protein
MEFDLYHWRRLAKLALYYVYITLIQYPFTCRSGKFLITDNFLWLCVYFQIFLFISTIFSLSHSTHFFLAQKINVNLLQINIPRRRRWKIIKSFFSHTKLCDHWLIVGSYIICKCVCMCIKPFAICSQHRFSFSTTRIGSL